MARTEPTRCDPTCGRRRRPRSPRPRPEVRIRTRPNRIDSPNNDPERGITWTDDDVPASKRQSASSSVSINAHANRIPDLVGSRPRGELRGDCLQRPRSVQPAGRRRQGPATPRTHLADDDTDDHQQPDRGDVATGTDPQRVVGPGVEEVVGDRGSHCRRQARGAPASAATTTMHDRTSATLATPKSSRTCSSRPAAARATAGPMARAMRPAGSSFVLIPK